ncbi:MAG TPA: CHAD domain-containing protein [Ramlibacter sp.]|uniref:CYTH and CHAD domain-containing protein n=1 Tax=Ramlibacter sp. TaxID=1917967 RepID=UPI002C9EE5DA|nr:CHAD domain-containing protein [Ramlibacter sp.]HVZ45718.1 CHAD domain-containing protein [Ramlibacter sp.]
MSEFEIKLNVPGDRLAAVQAAVRRGESRDERLRARYFDTEDGKLAARQVVLRLRQEGRHWVQTVKAPGDGMLDRLEHEVVLAEGEDARIRLARHKGTDAGKLLADALGGLGAKADASLGEQFRTDISRTTRLLTVGTTTVELALDTGRVIAGRRHEDIAELELELKQGSRASAIELAQRWCEQHGLWLDTVTKSMRGRRLAAAEERIEPTGFEAPELDANMDVPAVARAVVGSALSQVLGNASAIAADAYADEHVHQMRVGLRRLRTALREFQTLAPFCSPAEIQVLKDAFRALGAYRDSTYVEPRLIRQMEADGAPSGRLHVPRSDPPDPGATVREGRLQSVLLHVLGNLCTDGELPAADPHALHALIEARLKKLHRRVRKGTKDFAALPLEGQHALRKRLKHLRYLADFVGTLYRRTQVEDFLETIKPLQDALGEYQDTITALSAWNERTAIEAPAWFAVGWLQANRRAALAECEKACRRFRAEVRPFWR